jgi:5-methylcytosine-specific restriction enzyme A
VCGFSFLEIYGEHGRGFIEAHHKQPLSERTTKRSTRIEDMALVCANCHRMIHTGDKTLTLEELKALLQNKGTDAD